MGSKHMRQTELSLDEMLADTIVQMVMRRDGVSEDEVREVMARVRRRAQPETAAIGEARSFAA